MGFDPYLEDRLKRRAGYMQEMRRFAERGRAFAFLPAAEKIKQTAAMNRTVRKKRGQVQISLPKLNFQK
jgi:hypothetical protein